jgi:hypothetical protein
MKLAISPGSSVFQPINGGELIKKHGNSRETLEQEAKTLGNR